MPPRCAVNSMIAAKNLTLEGLEIAQLPRFMAEPYVADGALSPVLPEWAETPAPLHAVFASSRYLAPKVRSVVVLCVSMFTGDGIHAR